MYIAIIIAVVITIVSIVGYFLYKDYTKPVDAICRLNEENITANYIISPTPISGYELLKEKNVVVVDSQYIKYYIYHNKLNREFFALDPAIVSTTPSSTNINSKLIYYSATLKPGVTTLVNSSKNITPAVTTCTYKYPQTIYIPRYVYTLILEEIPTPLNFGTLVTNLSSTNPAFAISNKYISLTALPQTISVWLKLNQVASTMTSGYIFGNFGLVSNPVYVSIDTGYKPRMVWSSTNGSGNVLFNISLSPNVWYNLTFVKFSSTSFMLYVNGVARILPSTPTIDGSVTNVNYRIGRNPTTATEATTFKGFLYDLCINSVALSQDEVVDRYNKQLSELKLLTPASSSTDMNAATIKGAW